MVFGRNFIVEIAIKLCPYTILEPFRFTVDPLHSVK